MSSPSPVVSSTTMLREQNNNTTSNQNNNNNNGRLIKANSFSFRRRYFLKSNDDPPQSPHPLEDQHRLATFIRPQSQAQPKSPSPSTRTTLSLRSFRSSLDSNASGFAKRGGFLDKNSNHSYPTSPTTTTTTASIRSSSSTCSTPPVSPSHRIPIFRNSMPKTGVSRAASTRMTGVQQLSTSWEFIR